MNRFICAVLLASCSSEPGPALAEGKGIRITSSDLEAQLAELAPPVRQAMQKPERRRQLLDNLIRLELLARAAEDEGLANDPTVRFALKKALAARYHERFLEVHRATRPITDADVSAYFEEHREDFSRPARVRVEYLFLAAEEGSAARPAKAAQARSLLAGVLAAEPTRPDALARAAKESSDDGLTRPFGGDLGFKTREELEAWGPEVADAAFALQPGHTGDAVIESPHGFVLLRVVERQEPQTRTIAEVREQIAARLATQRADEDFEQRVSGLRDAAGLRVAEELPPGR